MKPTPAPQEGRVLELTIESLAAGGDGVAHAPSGRVCFVPLTVPGDRIRARIVEEHARFARCEIVELLAPGASRTEPRCAVFGACGGCTWQQVAYPAQLAAKRAILRSALERIGHLLPLGEVEILPAPLPYGYRSRTRVLVQGGRVGYRRRRSHELCPTKHCPILVPALDAALERLRAPSPRHEGEWELTAGDGGALRLEKLPSTPSTRPSSELAIRVGEDELALSQGVFVQSNAGLRDALASAVHEAAGHGQLVLELFAGAGFLTLGLARRFARVVAVEGDAPSAADLRRNAQRAGLGQIEVRCLPVEHALASGLGATPDAIVLDPPRKGLAPGAAASLAQLGAARVVYLSCDPATLARDLGVLCGRGYRLEQVRGFDLFPQTPHVEALATLVIGASRG